MARNSNRIVVNANQKKLFQTEEKPQKLKVKHTKKEPKYLRLKAEWGYPTFYNH